MPAGNLLTDDLLLVSILYNVYFLMLGFWFWLINYSIFAPPCIQCFQEAFVTRSLIKISFFHLRSLRFCRFCSAFDELLRFELRCFECEELTDRFWQLCVVLLFIFFNGDFNINIGTLAHRRGRSQSLAWLGHCHAPFLPRSFDEFEDLQLVAKGHFHEVQVSIF